MSDRPRPARAGSSSRSARRCWSTRPAARSAATGSRRWPTTSRACRARGQRGACSSRPAPSPSAAAISGSPAGALKLEEKPGRRRDRPDPPRARLSGGAGAARHHRRAGPADARRYRGAPPLSQRPRRPWRTLLALGAVPVINENDTVATDEIRFGDNDRLAARVAADDLADTLVLLSDIDGLYTADPRSDPGARHIPEIARDHARDRGDGRRRAAPATAPAAW